MKNFLQYTFRSPFINTAASTLAVALGWMLIFYIMNEPRHSTIIFGAWFIIFSIGMAGNYYRYRQYKRFEREVNKRLRSRLN